MAALGWLMNLGMAGSTSAAAVVAEPDALPDAGSGRKPYQPLTYVDPWELYGKPRQRLKLREKDRRVRRARKQLPEAEQAGLDALTGQISALQRQARAFEARVERTATEAAEIAQAIADARAQAQLDALIAKRAEEYRALVERGAAIEQQIARMEHKARLLKEDELFLNMIVELI